MIVLDLQESSLSGRGWVITTAACCSHSTQIRLLPFARREGLVKSISIARRASMCTSAMASTTREAGLGYMPAVYTESSLLRKSPRFSCHQRIPSMGLRGRKSFPSKLFDILSITRSAGCDEATKPCAHFSGKGQKVGPSLCMVLVISMC